MSEREVIIMQGIPGSGKSTLAHKLADEEREEHAAARPPPGCCAPPPHDDWAAVVYSTDDFFVHAGVYRFDVTKLSEAHARTFKRFIEALEDEVGLVIVDNTNTTAWEISPYMLGAQAFGYPARIFRVLADPQVAFERGTHGVPLEAIQRMAKAIETGWLPPWWTVETFP